MIVTNNGAPPATFGSVPQGAVFGYIGHYALKTSGITALGFSYNAVWLHNGNPINVEDETAVELKPSAELLVEGSKR